ncbi:protein RarD [Priestia megaterium]|jgi:chloramphenicol-sensitive protein RarD|uniref:EamA family transporter RarD n=1 Tax=Priestia megaterium TaxID=1404 RepID=UPI000BF839FE|nr:EamA family transporter RarD [Priestia megaterium]RFB20941.1 EamA family transporter RarD [Bacillus sp. ALD]MCR8866005.1 EamA family transporter RarD [Priestia megaterium]MDR7207437.1 chloramphenicol-sensitive protein RarD [Priestia megaterium]PFK60638.1 protein RarD [Priestia megaterium]PFP45491.1 protein RarD [Priestia megaterium]
MKLNYEKDGVMYAILSYLMWGITPIYWKLVQHVPSGEILAQRVFWAFIFMLILLFAMKKWHTYIIFVKEIMKKPALFWSLFIASVLISANWGIFMWAVMKGKILEASLGQYIIPLTSVLLGVIVLKEKLNRTQILAFILAGIGVLTLTLHYGVFPWISLSLALTFGLYGLAKRKIKADSTIGLTLETMVISPIALVYILYLMFQSQSQFFDSFSTSLLLMGGGMVTALPLLLFTKSAKKVSLSMLGILQYISPTLSLLVGVGLYHESLTRAHFIAFIFIWLALAIYTFSSITKRGQENKKQLENKSKIEA